MARTINLKDGGIRKNVDNYNKGVIRSYCITIIFFIGLLGVMLYVNYKDDPEFYIRASLPFAVIILPFIIFELVAIIKNKIYLNDFEKSPIYKELKKRYNFNNINDFEKFDHKVTTEIERDTLVDPKKSMLICTKSYLIKYHLPINKNFHVYDASKLLLVVFNPLSTADKFLNLRCRTRRGHQLLLYFEDEVVEMEVLTKKIGKEQSNSIAKAYKVLKASNTELTNFYNTDRDKFIKSCREQAKEVYGE